MADDEQRPDATAELQRYWVEQLADRVDQLTQARPVDLEDASRLAGRLAEAQLWLRLISGAPRGQDRLADVTAEALSLLAAPDTDPTPPTGGQKALKLPDLHEPAARHEPPSGGRDGEHP